MGILNLKTAALAIVAGVGLSGCAYGPYGGLGVGVGYGNGYYDPYYGGSYYNSGYGYPYGSGYGYGYPYGGYGSSYYGWNNGFYYPGTGYYVYDRNRRPHRWTDAQRRYWERQRGVATSSGGISRVIENWGDFQNGPQASNNVVRQRTVSNNRVFRNNPVVQERRVQTVQQQDRRAARAEAREERQERRRGNRRADRD